MLAAASAQAQADAVPGYIVLERGDTLRGSIKPIGVGDLTRGVYFQPGTAPESRLYPVKVLRAVGMTGGPRYETRKMTRMLGGDTLRVLMEPLIKGRANLLRSAYDPHYNQIDRVYANSLALRFYYIERGSGPYRAPFQLTENNFRESLRSLFSDCPNPPVVKGPFTEANLLKLITEYNTCSDRFSN
jgi:hypothetical protein